MECIQFRFPSWAVVATLVGLALLIFGCGGGGGGGGGSATTSSQNNGSTNAGVAEVQLVPIYSGTESPAGQAANSTSSSTVYSFEVGDKINLEYIGVSTTSNSVHITVQGSQVVTNAPSSVGSMSGNIFTVTGASGSNSYALTGAYQGTAFSLKFVSVAKEAQVVGTVRDPTLAPVINVPITFVNASGTVVGKTITGLDGSFMASLPTSAVGFFADFSGFGSYYNEYSYGSSNYAISVAGCTTSLPKLATGTRTALPNQVVPYLYDQSDPPPVPDGCGS